MLASKTHAQRAWILANVCQLAYQNDASGQLKQLGFTAPVPPEHIEISGQLCHSATGLKWLVAETAEDVVLAFRGSMASMDSVADAFSTLMNWAVNFQARPVKCCYPGKVHTGFAETARVAWDIVWAHLDHLHRLDPQKRLWATGHSLGGALAALIASRLHEKRRQVAGVYTFGSPRVGNREFARHYEPACHFRFQNRMDMVAWLTPPAHDCSEELKRVLCFLATMFGKKLHLDDELFTYAHLDACQFLHWDGTIRAKEPDLSSRFFSGVAALDDLTGDHGLGRYIEALAAAVQREQQQAPLAAPRPAAPQPLCHGSLYQGQAAAWDFHLPPGNHALAVRLAAGQALFHMDVYAPWQPHPIASTNSASGACVVPVSGTAGGALPVRLRVACVQGHGAYQVWHQPH